MSLEVSEFPLQLEYKKHSNKAPADIARLRDWLHTQPHMPDKYITDLDLILAYHSCNCSMEVTKQLLDLHYTFKTHSTLFKDYHLINNTLEQLKVTIILPLKTRAYDGSAVLYAAIQDTDIKKFNFFEGVRAITMVMSLWQLEEGSWSGLQLVADMSNVSLQHLSKLDLDTMQQLFFYLQEVIPIKLKMLHYINAPSFMNKLLFLMKPFMKASLLKELHIHQTMDTLEPHVPVAALPADVGGRYLTLKEAEANMIQKLKNNQPFFISEQKKRVDENLRPGKPKTLTDIFGGIEGSFKKLDID